MKFEINVNKQTEKVEEIILIESLKVEITEFANYASKLKNRAGLAANQCLLDGVVNNKRYFVIINQSKQYTAIINPKITSYNGIKSTVIEGCLSYPNKKIKAERYNEISVKYLNLDGEEKTEKINGMSAQIFQHEYDHLEGKEEFVFDGNLKSEKIDRNDPCICGSGKKYKKCCGV